ncbi:sterol desaturase family protein [Flammeovirga agarivorans]|uniref:Fatty acid hydroxylase n=1 Tax=Flammeovirga agarivorans TaxID=2726742 RepID=A0A7X8SIE8_9BACT|nr:sterol desaturase family protein [Flammeovirga agarivorans]NLR90794.1 fatty acid hydroxylase [Flammeovirga agarivorans]
MSLAQNKKAKTLFENPILEKLTHTHAAVPISMYAIIGSFLVIYGVYNQFLGTIQAIGLYCLGVLFFTFIEYAMHRFVFHMEPDTELKKNITHKFHGVHHDFPKDKSRLAMPPVVSLFLSAAFFGLFYYLMGDYAYGFGGGFLTGYAMYLGVHYIVHAYRPPKNFLKILWIHHGIHHYKTDDKAFGVSSPLWDVIFRTMP